MSPAARTAFLLAVGLLVASAATVLLGAGVGSTGFQSVLDARDDPVAWQIVWDIRLPRTIGAWMAGALLGLAGAVAQGLFRNPLADPYLLGSASGAALGVAACALASWQLAQGGAGYCAALPWLALVLSVLGFVRFIAARDRTPSLKPLFGGAMILFFFLNIVAVLGANAAVR